MNTAIRRWSAVAALSVAAILSACASSVSVADDAGGKGQAVPARQPPFGECQADAFAFVGETSMADIGLGDLAGGPDANRVGSVWVTSAPVAPDAFPGPGMPAPGRMVCIEWPDGSGMSTTVDDAWQPPGIDVASGGAGASGEIAVGSIAAVVVALLVIVVSYVAFRRDPHAREPS